MTPGDIAVPALYIGAWAAALVLTELLPSRSQRYTIVASCIYVVASALLLFGIEAASGHFLGGHGHAPATLDAAVVFLNEQLWIKTPFVMVSAASWWHLMSKGVSSTCAWGVVIGVPSAVEIVMHGVGGDDILGTMLRTLVAACCGGAMGWWFSRHGASCIAAEGNA